MTETTAVATTNGKMPVTIGGPQSDFDSLYRLAANLAQSSLLPSALKGKPSDVLVAILYGQELGIAPMQAINAIDVIEGRPSLSAHLRVALTRKAGHKVKITEDTAESCTVTITRRDDHENPVTVTYTIADARTAGLTNKNNWKQNPKSMLYARAVTMACKRACPEIAMGFVDETERPDPEPKPTLGQVAAARDAAAREQATEPEQHTTGDVIDGEVEEAEPTADADMLAELAEIEDENSPDSSGLADNLFSGNGGEDQ